jgi:hypothetical protein
MVRQVLPDKRNSRFETGIAPYDFTLEVRAILFKRIGFIGTVLNSL